jgi:hypothetical protein
MTKTNWLPNVVGAAAALALGLLAAAFYESRPALKVGDSYSIPINVFGQKLELVGKIDKIEQMSISNTDPDEHDCACGDELTSKEVVLLRHPDYIRK